MNFKFDINVKVTPQEVEAILKEAIETNNPKYAVESIQLNTRKVTHGYGYGEYTDYVFDGADVKLKPRA